MRYRATDGTIAPMKISLPVVILGTQFLVPVSEQVPVFDVSVSCRAAATAGMAADESYRSCMSDERSAREELLRGWTSFAAKRSQPLHHRGLGGRIAELRRTAGVSADVARRRKDADAAAAGRPEEKMSIKILRHTAASPRPPWRAIADRVRNPARG